MGTILKKELEATNNYRLCLNTKRIINTKIDQNTIITDAMKVIFILDKWQVHFNMTDDLHFEILA